MRLSSILALLGALLAGALVAVSTRAAAPAAGHKPTVYLIGDSTVRNGTMDNGSTAGQWGWGHILHYYFDPAKVTVVNDAMGGTSSRSYFESPRLWGLVLPRIQPGDFVLIQFGHNDGGNPAQRPVASLRGVDNATTQVAPPPARGAGGGRGAATQPAAEAAAGGEIAKVEVHTYGWYLRQYIQQIKAKGATPIVCSLIPRNRWANGKVNRNKQDFALWAQQVAEQEGVPFIPLNDLVADKYDQLGQEKVAAELFPPNEAVHPNWAGAALNASLVVEGIKSLKDCPLKDYLVADPKVPATADITPPAHGELGPAGEAALRPRRPAPATLP